MRKQARSTYLNKHKSQQGFTLIELMVVVVIMSVVVSVGILSLGRFNQDLLENQQAKIESYFTQIADQSTFSQTMYLIVPDDEGLTPFKYVDYQWQSVEDMSVLLWHSGFVAEWEVDEHFAEQQSLPRPGWVFWPSGDVLAGKILLKSINDGVADPADNEVALSWNESLEFAKR